MAITSSCARNSELLKGIPRTALVTLAALGTLTASCIVTPYGGPGQAPNTASDVAFGQTPEAGIDSSGTDKQGPESIVARHILVQYQGSLRAPGSITRTKPEAQHRAEEALTRARAGEPFEGLVQEYSDEPGAAGRGGTLGRFTRDAMVEEFANAAFALEVGELSEVVESPFGFHVIIREE